MTKKPKRSPAFQFYPSNFLGSPKVMVMTAEEVGIYTLLMCLEWEQDGRFTEEEARELMSARRITDEQFDAAWPRVSRCFIAKSDGTYHNARLDAERKKQNEWRRKSSKGGKLSAAKRLKGGSTVVQPQGNRPVEHSVSVSDSVTTKTTTPRVKREKKSEKPATPRPANWVSRIAQVFRDGGGSVREGHVGAALKPTVEKFGEGVVIAAAGLWLNDRKANGWSCGFPKFAEDHVRWCEQAIKLQEAALSGVDYWDNDALQLLTRPTLVA